MGILKSTYSVGKSPSPVPFANPTLDGPYSALGRMISLRICPKAFLSNSAGRRGTTQLASPYPILG